MKYKLKENEYVQFREIEGIEFDSKDLKISRGIATAKKSYGWDGCSPKLQIKIFGKTFITGTPDFFIYLASCFHDLLYENRIKGLSRYVVDLIFYKHIMQEGTIWAVGQYRYDNKLGDFLRFIFIGTPKLFFVQFIAVTYFLAVRLFGWLWWNKCV